MDEDPLQSDAYHRTLLECLPRSWPKHATIEAQYATQTAELLVAVIIQSNWQIQLIVVQSVNAILQKSATMPTSGITPLLEPIINLGPRTKSSGLKREILKFIRIALAIDRYAQCFDEQEHLREVLKFNIDEMIHDTRSNEISEQAKELKKQHEHLFRQTKKRDEHIETINVDPTENNLF